jgi:hypothetical protein
MWYRFFDADCLVFNTIAKLFYHLSSFEQAIEFKQNIFTEWNYFSSFTLNSNSENGSKNLANPIKSNKRVLKHVQNKSKCN